MEKVIELGADDMELGLKIASKDCPRWYYFSERNSVKNNKFARSTIHVLILLYRTV